MPLTPHKIEVSELIGDPRATHCVCACPLKGDPYSEGTILFRGSKDDCEAHLGVMPKSEGGPPDDHLTLRTFASANPSSDHDEHVVRIGMTKLQWVQIRRLRNVAREHELEYVSRHFPAGLNLLITVHEGGHQRVDHAQLKPKFVTSDGEDVRPEFVYLHVGREELWVTYRSKNHDGPKWESDHVQISLIDRTWGSAVKHMKGKS